MRYVLLLVLCLGFSISNYSQTQRDTILEIPSESFNTTRKIQVHLPKKFKDTESLPVIFVFDAQWQPYFKLVTATIDYLIETRELPRSIVVGINNEKRQYELTPAPVNEDWKVPNLGGAAFLENHLINEVIPVLNNKYHAENFRIGIGHSLGGTFVLNSLVDQPDLFNAYIAISPNLELDDEEIILKIGRNLSKIKDSNTFIFTTIGTDGNPDTQFLPPVKKLDSIVQPHNGTHFNWNFSIYKGYNHATTPLASIQSALLKLSEKWKMTDNQKNEMVKGNDVLGQFQLFYNKLSDWAGYTVIPQQHDYFSFVGFLENEEKYEDAIKIYKAAITNYPGNSRFYNGVAENLLHLGTKEEAKKYVQLALDTLKNETFNYPGDKAYFEKKYNSTLEKINEK